MSKATTLLYTTTPKLTSNLIDVSKLIINTIILAITTSYPNY